MNLRPCSHVIIAAAMLACVSPLQAQDRAALTDRIEMLGSTSSFDRWPMSDRGNSRYQSMISLGEDSHGIKTTWEHLELNGCTMTITAGFWATGQSLPTRRIDIDITDSSVLFALAPDNGWGSEGVQITLGNPNQTILVVKGPDFGSWEESAASIRAQVFTTRPAPRYFLPVYFPEGRPTTAPELLGAIGEYRAQFCALAS
jgi:hypothetical protein